jgi:two-component system, chemotaxis family, response regulator WspR
MTEQVQSSPVLATSPSNDYVTMVLLVDDQAMIGEAVRRMLVNQTNMNFHYCAQPSQAIALAKEVRPTVILQDLVMPGIDGLDLVRQYRQDPATASIPIIVLSTKEEPTIKSEAFSAGANDYLVKLPDRLELIARLRYHSRAYVNQLQRDDAYRALRDSQQQLMEANLELQRLTKVDGLTGLSNRRYFDEYLAAEWQRMTHLQNTLSVLMIDVDDFKRYNDAYGHLAGDEVLRRIADVIQINCGRSGDLGARFGGEEFAIILPGTSLLGTQHLGAKLCQEIDDLHLPHRASAVTDHVTVSIGGASIIPQPSQPPAHLVDAADKALYRAKAGGRNRLILHAHLIPVDREQDP